MSKILSVYRKNVVCNKRKVCSTLLQGPWYIRDPSITEKKGFLDSKKWVWIENFHHFLLLSLTTSHDRMPPEVVGMLFSAAHFRSSGSQSPEAQAHGHSSAPLLLVGNAHFHLEQQNAHLCI